MRGPAPYLKKWGPGSPYAPASDATTPISLSSDPTRELPGERDNARNNARCTQAWKTTHGLDGQHQDVDRTPRGRVGQNDRGER